MKLNRSGKFFVGLLVAYAIGLLFVFGAKRVAADRGGYDGSQVNLNQVRAEALHAAIHEGGARCEDDGCWLNRRCGSPSGER